MTYVCLVSLLALVVQICHGSESLDIRLPPFIIAQGKRHIYYRPDTTVTLACVAGGSPKPRYVWYKNGHPFDQNSGVQLDEGNLTLSVLNNRHAGYYQCRAINNYGTALSDVVFLQKAVLSTFEETSEPREFIGTLGSPMKVPCYQDGSVPEPRIQWEITEGINTDFSTPLGLNHRVITDKNGTLYFTNLHMDDERNGHIYKCVSRNAPLDVHQGGSYSIIRVHDVNRDPPPMSKLYATEEVVGLIGGEVTLKCIFGGSPAPEVLWTDNNGHNPQQSNQQTQAYGTELKITNLQERDAGAYYCQGYQTSLSKHSDKIRLNLLVQAVPRFIENKSPQSKNTSDGQTHTFQCAAKGDPEPIVHWLINGAPVGNLTRPHHLFGGNLTISKLYKNRDGRSDLMTVQCNASNVHGYAFASVYLNVLERTQLTVSPESITYTPNMTSVSISCQARTDPSTPLSVIWMHRQNILHSGADPRLNITDDNTITIDLEELELQEVANRFSGAYLCVANNTYTSTTGESQILVPGAKPTESPVVATASHLWWILLVIMVLLLLLLLVLCCCLCLQRNKGDMYPVDEKEREHGRDPVKECAADGFLDYQRPEDLQPSKGSRASLTSTLPDLDRSVDLNRSMDRSMDQDDASLGSLSVYGDFAAGKFNEDGSFIGRYATGSRKNSRSDSLGHM